MTEYKAPVEIAEGFEIYSNLDRDGDLEFTVEYVVHSWHGSSVEERSTYLNRGQQIALRDHLNTIING